MAEPARGKGVKLYGPLFDPAHAGEFQAHLQATMKGHADALEGKLKAKAPVKSGGTRDSVKVSVAAAKASKKTGKGANKWIAIRAEATATRKPAKGDPPRRYGRVPTGVWTDNKTGWLTGTVEAEQGALLGALKTAAVEFVAKTNAASPKPATGAA